MFKQLIAMGHFWHQTCWLDGLHVGWLQLFPHYVQRLRRGGVEKAVSVKQSSVVRMGMSKQHNNL